MKISNIILISSLTIIGLFLLSLFIQVDPEKYRKNLVESKTSCISPFSHLKINKGVNIIVNHGLSDSVKVTFKKGEIVTIPEYLISGDTLTIDSIPGYGDRFIELVSSRLKSVEIMNGQIQFHNISLQNLSITSKSSFISAYNKASIDSLWMNLSANSNFYCYGSKLTNVNLVLNRSKAQLYNHLINNLNADLRDSSELRNNKTTTINIHLRTDETSKLE